MRRMEGICPPEMWSRRKVTGLFAGLAVAAAAGPILAGAPSDTAHFTFPDGTAATEWLPFNMPDLRHIVLPVTINGVKASAILDSGAGSAVIARAFAVKLGLVPVGSITGIGVSGGVGGSVAAGVKIGLGALTFDTGQVSIFDLTPLEAAASRRIDAVLGRDLFDALMIDFDFDARKLALRRPDAGYHLPEATSIALTVSDFGLRSLPISIENAAPVQALLDLGADRALYLSPAYAARRNFPREHRLSTAMSAGVGGFEVSKVLVVNSLSVGPTDFAAVPTEIPPSWSYRTDAVVGFPIFRRFRLLVDFPNNRIDAAPGPDIAPFRKDRAGLGTRRDGDQLEILHVAAGSPAAAAGLVVGDRIVAVNGRKLDSAYFKENIRNGSLPAGTPVSFLLSDGRTVNFILADYF